MDKPKRIFVTGGTGYVGVHLVNKLLQAGHQVHLLILHEQEKAFFSPSPQLTFIPGNILDMNSIVKGMEGCHQVFHLAGYAKNYSKNKQVFFDINVQGSLNICLAAKKFSSIEKIVATSTIVTLGPTKDGIMGDETIKRSTEKFFTTYEESKALGEVKLLEYSKELPIVIVNPTRVFGPGLLTEGNSLAKLIIDFYNYKVPFLLSQGQHVGNYVFVDDLVQGHILAMQFGKIGERYILGGENKSLKEFFKILSKHLNVFRFQFPLPEMLIYAFSKFEELRADHSDYYPLITPGWIDTFAHHWAYSTQKAENEIHYKITPFDQAIKLTVDWLRKDGHIK